MSKYSKEFKVAGTESTATGRIDVKFEVYSLHPFRLLSKESSNQRIGVEIDALVNGDYFSRQFINEYIAQGEENNEQYLLDSLDKTESSMRKYMSWIANGGQKSFDEKMSERGFSLTEKTYDAKKEIS